MGTKVEVVISRDDTQYAFKNGDTLGNLYEKLTLKCTKDVQVPIGAVVMPKGAQAVIYGEHRNMLSIKCEDILIAKKAAE